MRYTYNPSIFRLYGKTLHKKNEQRKSNMLNLENVIKNRSLRHLPLL